jgi:hypothetical protein
VSAPDGWTEILGRVEPHVSPEWTRHARESGDQSWVRLILLVDAHWQLSTPRVTEKVAMTMADLAVDREGERAGWEAIREKAEAERLELVPLFARSIEPAPPGMR